MFLDTYTLTESSCFGSGEPQGPWYASCKATVNVLFIGPDTLFHSGWLSVRIFVDSDVPYGLCQSAKCLDRIELQAPIFWKAKGQYRRNRKLGFGAMCQ
jgi:hypothetical protein